MSDNTKLLSAALIAFGAAFCLIFLDIKPRTNRLWVGYIVLLHNLENC